MSVYCTESKAPDVRMNCKKLHGTVKNCVRVLRRIPFNSHFEIGFFVRAL
jgi:hypothetical protein